jgi:hypothetical protein
MLIKIMSDQHSLHDTNPQKAFTIYEDITKLSFKKIDNDYYAILHDVVEKQFSARLIGNLYVLNELGDVISRFSASSDIPKLIGMTLEDTDHPAVIVAGSKIDELEKRLKSVESRLNTTIEVYNDRFARIDKDTNRPRIST